MSEVKCLKENATTQQSRAKMLTDIINEAVTKVSEQPHYRRGPFIIDDSELEKYVLSAAS